MYHLNSPNRVLNLLGAACLYFILLLGSMPASGQVLLPEENAGKTRSVALDLANLRAVLANAPMEYSESAKREAVSLNLPTPNGDDLVFKAVESPIMAADFATAYPLFKTYSIRSEKDPAMTGRLMVSPYGVNAVYFSEKGLVEISPEDLLNPVMHRVSINVLNPEGMFCGFNEGLGKPLDVTGLEKSTFTNGTTTRTYQFAIVTTGEYAVTHGGTVGSATAAVTAMMNALRAIYERELAVKFTLLTPVIYLNPATDPFPSANTDRLLMASETIAANFSVGSYDLGHVLHSTGGGATWEGGIAAFGLCNDNFYSGSTTGRTKGAAWSTVGTTFTGQIALFAHEVGHQFYMNHTFNGSNTFPVTAPLPVPCNNVCDCSISNSTSYEIGSGTTLLSYNGLCAANQNIPSGGAADLYFHTHSLVEATNRMMATSCHTASASGNTPPVINANPCGLTYTIPRGTPFRLRGTGTDANGDVIYYAWEQYDEDGPGVNPTQGFIGANAANSSIAPLFRSFPPTTSPERTFPNMSLVAANNYTSDFEPLPNVARTLNFRLTGRDWRTEGGGINSSALVVTVSASGPFTVNAPNGGETLASGSATTVTWSTNTTAFCSNVNIRLSIDGGLTYPYTLATNVANSLGSRSVAIPAGVPNTANARIMVECADNTCVVFFDISNANFFITSACSAPATEISPVNAVTFPQGDPGLNLGLSNNLGAVVANFAGTVATSDPSGTLVFLNGTPAACNSFSNNTNYDLFVFSPDVTGAYTFTFTGPFGLVLNLYAAAFTGSNCTNHISSSATRPTGMGAISLGSSVSATLTANSTYILMVSSFGSGTPALPASYTIAFTKPAGSNIYNGVILPAGYAYTYVAVNTATGQVTLVNAGSNFTALPGGVYQIYGAAYKASGATPPPLVNPATWLGQTLSQILASGNCVLFSNNFKMVTVQAPAGCNLATAGLTNVSCNNNGTPSNSADDRILFSLNPTGSNLGATYTVSVSIGSVTPTTGTYGAATAFTMNAGSAGAGNVTVTITDAASAGCTLMATITNPGTCSGTCSLVSAGLSGVSCNNNGTPSNSADDRILFSLNPTGSNLGATYTVSVSIGSVTPTTGTYGAATAFTMNAGSAGAGNVTVTITDAASAGCTLMATITNPGTCSGTCNLASAGLSSVSCNNNGTPSNSADDRILFSLNPTGSNLGATYTVSVSSGSVTPTTGTYGAATAFTMNAGSAGAGNVTVTITDAASAGCTLMATITNPGTCSGTCNLASAGLSSVSCNNNGTPSNSADDRILFSLNPTGTNLGATYTVSASIGSVTPTTGTYGAATAFTMNAGSAGAGNVTVTITDAASAGCTLMATITNPGTCSGTCSLVSAGLTNVSCNNNGTPSNSADDRILFSLNPTGSNLGATYTVTVSNGSVTPTTGTYGAATAFTMNAGSAGAGNVTVTITDAASAGCTIMATITNPGTCSGTCNLASAGLTNVSCNNNGTLSNSADDRILFNLNPTGSNLGATYTVSVSTGSVTPTTGTYGAATAFTMNAGSAGAGNVTVTITDAASAGCTLMATITNPGTCSGTCSLVSAGLSGVSCNNNGTPSNSADDRILFSLNPTGSNLGATYTVSASIGSVTPTTGTYGAATAFTMNAGSAGAGNVTVTITDAASLGCTLMATITNPGTCSGTCSLVSAGLSRVSCNNNGTPSNSADDRILFSLNPTGSNLGATYTVSVSSGSVTPTTGTYGAATAFTMNAGSAGAGNVTVTITDAASAGCTIMATITNPGTCSGTCNLASAGLSGVTCNNNGTPSNSADDRILFSLNPTGTNLGATYTVTVSNGSVTPTTGTYGAATAFTMNAGSAGAGNVTVTITDAASAGCTIVATITNPGTCSGTCNLASAGLSSVSCNNNGTPSNSADDRILFSLNPTGSNLGATYTVSVSSGSVTPTTGTYGAATAFTMNAGSAGAGNVTVTVNDAVSLECTVMATITNPGTCSGTCNLATAGLTNVSCNNNGTPSNSADDRILFSLNPTGSNLGATYTVTVSIGSVTPTTGTYGAATAFTMNAGSAGAGNVTVTITDAASAGCTLMATLTNPGTCSSSGICTLTSAGLNNVNCDDNGTPSNSADDRITFRLNPTGTNLGTTYTVSVSSGSVTPTTGTYGPNTTFTMNAGSGGAGNVTVTVTDATSPGCTIMATLVDPGSAGPLPPGWSNSDVGGPAVNGSAYMNCSGDFVVKANGFSTPTSDQLHIAYQQLCANGEIIARIKNASGGGWGGITLRETLMPGSKKVGLKTQLTPNIRREIRSVTNGAASIFNLFRPQHTWLRLVRSGSSFTGYTSTNGATWSFAFSATVSMSGCIYAGIFAESVNGNTTTTATFDNVSITGSTFSLALPDIDFVEMAMPDIQVYPNPASGEVNVVLGAYTNRKVLLELYDAQGRVIKIIELSPVETTVERLDLSAYQDGLYLIRVSSEGVPDALRRIILAN